MWLYINVTYILDTLGVNTCVELGVIPVLMSKRIISKPTPQYSQDIRDHSILLAQSPTPNNNKKMDIFSCITSIRNTNQPTKLQPQPSTPPPTTPIGISSASHSSGSPQLPSLVRAICKPPNQKKTSPEKLKNCGRFQSLHRREKQRYHRSKKDSWQ